MGEKKIALRYAKSLFELSRGQGVLEEVHENMQLVASVCKSNQDLVNVLRSPVIKPDKKQAVLEKIFLRKVHGFTTDVIRLLTRKNRASLLFAMAVEFHVLYNEFKRVQQAVITTTISLDDELRSSVKKIIQKYSDREVIELEERLDSELIGGFVLDIGDKQINTSLSHQLKLLRIRFMEKSYA